MERMLTNILTDDIQATRDTLVNLLDFNVEFEAKWFVSLAKENIHVSAFKRNSEFIPEPYQLNAQGIILTFVVKNVETYYLRAKNQGINIVEAPTDMPYGQRRMLVKDPSGILLDISSPTAQLGSEYK
jgi:uncharacterized glyoxalase superfamily protein PhnB